MVIVDGELMNAYLIPAMKISGRKVTTIEGLKSEDGTLDRLQTFYLAEGAEKYGFCTPGMILNARGSTEQDPEPGYKVRLKR